ncbi:MAG: hypothetical protein RL189_1831 [Pseudomonadota bacterium]
MNTAYHAKLFAHQILAQSGSDAPDRISRALNDACIDLNPHQVTAALFALKNPLSKGCILADEVGLGKTIEAGLVVSQLWAEGKRSILIIAPKSLRHQWKDELERLFGLHSSVLNGDSYRRSIKSGENPLQDSTKIIITNEHFVDSNRDDIKRAKWDLVVIDEAHKLRNVWRKEKSQAKRAKAVRDALADFKKLLLTATPMQNNLMELFGLVSFIDERILGTSESFQNKFSNVSEEIRAERLIELKQRISRVFHRELRKNVREYIQYTDRNSVTFTYTPTEEEESLRIGFEDFLRRDRLISIPASSMPLLKLIYLKLLASSTFAIKNSLLNLYKRLVLAAVQMNDHALFDILLENIREKLFLSDGRRSEELRRFEDKLYARIAPKTYDGLREAYLSKLSDQFEFTDEEREINETYAAENDTIQEEMNSQKVEEEPSNEILFNADDIKEEAQTILGFIELSRKITENKKADALKLALEKQFEKARSEGWPEKAVIFTEFRTTQSYVLRVLNDCGINLKENVAIFNGDSGDVEERKRIVESFKANKKIFLTTEAGAEGLNLQFSNLILNYDLPWNPQRIEQRIGRCHRYGQKLDVIVVNFVNTKNSADVRVLELLQEKFNLFKGAFGASDEVLGAIESGQDFEQEILKIYLSCRSETEIKMAFDELRSNVGPEIDRRLESTRKTVLETFDEAVQSKLKITLDQTNAALTDLGQKLKCVLQSVAGNSIEWSSDGLTFELKKPLFDFPSGSYLLGSRGKNAIPIRTHTGLGEAVLKNAISQPTPTVGLNFDLKSRTTKVAQVYNLAGKSGVILVGRMHSQSLSTEEQILLVGMDSAGNAIDSEIVEKLFRFSAKIEPAKIDTKDFEELSAEINRRSSETVASIRRKNQELFVAEINRLDNWADDIKLSLELELKSIDRDIREAKTEGQKAQILEEKVALQKRVKVLESKRNEKRQQIFEAQDQIEREKDQLLAKIEANLDPKVQVEEIFMVKWTVK